MLRPNLRDPYGLVHKGAGLRFDVYRETKCEHENDEAHWTYEQLEPTADAPTCVQCAAARSL